MTRVNVRLTVDVDVELPQSREPRAFVLEEYARDPTFLLQLPGAAVSLEITELYEEATDR